MHFGTTPTAGLPENTLEATINWLIVFLQYRDHQWMSRLREASTLFKQLVL